MALWWALDHDRPARVEPLSDAQPEQLLPTDPPRRVSRARMARGQEVSLTRDASMAQEAAATEQADCAPRAAKACEAGDVYWFDACGGRQELVEACQGRPCLDIACAPAERFVSRCGSVTAYGRCDGDLALACVVGRLVKVDCAASGKRCTEGREGVHCETAGAGFCTGREPPRCEGKRLVQCVEGRFEVSDCARRSGRCEVADGVGRCVGAHAELQPRPLELCNQRDDDDDGKVDEDQVCEAVILVPVVAEGATLTDFEGRMQRDLEILNRVYQPRRFRWHEPISAPERLARFPAREVDRIGASINAQVAEALKGEFFVPVVFVEALDLEPPKGGISTLPNNSCGGVRLSDRASPPYGLIVLADERMPETLAHELGHYLGLCHTHEQVERFSLVDPRVPACEVTGDAICDTAYDPGPASCKADATCTVLCDDASARPLGADVMGYYLGCRRALSADQLREAERNLALRRGWARCLDAGACPCSPGDLKACPVDMSCRPLGGERFGCLLDGASLPGGACSDGAQCGQGAVCLTTGGPQAGRCVRACFPGCRCTDVGLAFRVCGEELGG